MIAWHRSEGFTLIELLVTIVIISIIVGLAVLSVGDNQAERERRLTTQLATLIGLARETAIFNSDELAMSFWKHGYSFYRLDQKGWQEIADDPQLRARELPEDITLSLYLEGLKAELLPTPKKEDKPDPQVFILSSGEVTPFEVRLGDGGDSEMQLTGDEFGNFEFALLEI
jgi:general secretion pathway protein H